MTQTTTQSLLKQEQRFKKILLWSAVTMVVLLSAFFITLVFSSLQSLFVNNFKFVFGPIWDAVSEEYGALPVLVGTLITSILALLISLPFSFSIALFLGEYFRKGALSSVLRMAIELLAGIPSVVYGFWALAVLVPLVRQFEIASGIVPFGVGIMTAALILAIMIIPYTASVSREVIQMVPQDLKEAAYSLGATKFEVVRHVIMPYAWSGTFAGILLSFGRAIGETMAVTMVIGNANKIPMHLFDTGNTMASIIANELAEATKPLYVSSLINIALLLFIVSALVNVLGKYVIKRFTVD